MSLRIEESDRKMTELVELTGPAMGALRARWEDEKEYEPWEDYSKFATQLFCKATEKCNIDFNRLAIIKQDDFIVWLEFMGRTFVLIYFLEGLQVLVNDGDDGGDDNDDE